MNAQAVSSAPVDILIADDDAEMRESLCLILEDKGYTCAQAENGRTAVELAHQHPPQVVLLDLRMPELDGFGVARELRADPRTCRSHIHCLTGSHDPAAVRQARQAGCELFLVKPIDPLTLLELVERQVERPDAEWVSGLTKSEAEALLDWLEAHGIGPREVALRGGRDFAVLCRWPRGFRALKDASGRLRFVETQEANGGR